MKNENISINSCKNMPYNTSVWTPPWRCDCNICPPPKPCPPPFPPFPPCPPPCPPCPPQPFPPCSSPFSQTPFPPYQTNFPPHQEQPYEPFLEHQPLFQKPCPSPIKNDCDDMVWLLIGYWFGNKNCRR